MGWFRRRRRRRGGFFRRVGRAFRSIGRAVGRVVRGVTRAVRSVVKGVARATGSLIKGVGRVIKDVVTFPVKLVKKIFGKKTNRTVPQGEKVINLQIDPSNAEIGDKIDLDWDDDEHTRDKMLRVFITRMAGPIKPIENKKGRG